MLLSRNSISSYLASYKGNSGLAYGENPLFFNRRGEPLSRWGVSHIIDKYVKRAQAKGVLCVGFPITPHTFRHSKVMHMLHAGINLFYIRDILGHVDVSTTEIYARADTEMKRKTIEASCEDIFPDKNLAGRIFLILNNVEMCPKLRLISRRPYAAHIGRHRAAFCVLQRKIVVYLQFRREEIFSMLCYNLNGYGTCIHSRKRRAAPWKVYESCSNPGRIPSLKGYELPYYAMCMNCRFYCKDSRTTIPSKSE